ncbi:TIGR01212 family radical SAM protein [Butyricimonas hominis]|uniref:TIGR01212 family radical SAM protein n=1 Tax=Butyricimonas hominis TaxID=2763032 RepID=A0ABR7D576_9BACT|nr:TIGR01212 family radical SAM protein [Butyricimonas hominis]MBC5623108.1 TIGR01212 family radical SAM protein [Butyricimonas hominis]
MFERDQKRYNDYPTYFRTLFGERVQKLSIDGGFTCPNRDGSKGIGGCSFCNNDSFNPDYCRAVEGITRQIEEGIRFFGHKYNKQKYLAYFQVYSNTYAPLEVLKQRYEEALAHPMIAGLVIGTRPDTVNDEVLDYLELLAREYYVCVEYGVESVNDEVLQRVNRGHGFAASERAIRGTAGRGIAIGAHLIFGLPGESRESMLEGAVRLCELPIQVLKLHQLQIVKDTRMAEEYAENPSAFQLYTQEEYLDFVVEVIERIRPDVYLERFVNQSPPEYLIAPKWGIKNFEFTAKLDKRLRELDTWQGKER